MNVMEMDWLLAIRFDVDTVGDFLFNPIILRAMRKTLYIALLAMVLGVVLGTVLAVMRVSRNPIVSAPAGVYVWFWRATPVILQLLMVWFGLRQVIDEDIFRDVMAKAKALRAVDEPRVKVMMAQMSNRLKGDNFKRYEVDLKSGRLDAD